MNVFDMFDQILHKHHDGENPEYDEMKRDLDVANLSYFIHSEAEKTMPDRIRRYPLKCDRCNFVTTHEVDTEYKTGTCGQCGKLRSLTEKEIKEIPTGENVKENQ